MELPKEKCPSSADSQRNVGKRRWHREETTVEVSCEGTAEKPSMIEAALRENGMGYCPCGKVLLGGNSGAKGDSSRAATVCRL